MTQQGSQQQPYQLPPLPYDFGALEPAISAEIMTLHYTKHHQTYVNNLNKALEQLAEAQQKHDLAATAALLSAIKFNGGETLTTPFSGQTFPPSTKTVESPPKELSHKRSIKSLGLFRLSPTN